MQSARRRRPENDFCNNCKEWYHDGCMKIRSEACTDKDFIWNCTYCWYLLILINYYSWYVYSSELLIFKPCTVEKLGVVSRPVSYIATSLVVGGPHNHRDIRHPGGGKTWAHFLWRTFPPSCRPLVTSKRHQNVHHPKYYAIGCQRSFKGRHGQRQRRRRLEGTAMHFWESGTHSTREAGKKAPELGQPVS